jgi:CARDB
LVITSLQWSDDQGLTWHTKSVPAQSNLLFRAKVKNAGTAAFPKPKQIRVDFRVNGSLVAWSDTYRSGLSAGASKLLVANTGPDGDAVWYDAPAGTHTVFARIDPLNTYAELNESNNTRSATLTVDPLPNSPEISETLPFFGQYYGGPLFGGTTAANSVMNYNTLHGQSVFFYAERTGVITGVFHHFRTGTNGYAAGDGGKYTIEIVPADPNTKLRLPGAQPICQITNYQGPAAGGSHSNREITFTTQGKVVAGQAYVYTLRNTHANPRSNYSSSNVGLHSGFTDTNFFEPTGGIDPANLGSVPAKVNGLVPIVIDGKRWYPYPHKARDGVFQVSRCGPQYTIFRYADGVSTGWGCWGGGKEYKKAISGQNQLRVRFRVTRATRVVSGVLMRLVRLNNCGGTLVVRLESGGGDNANGLPVETVNVPANVIYDAGPSENNAQWARDPFDMPHYIWVPFTQNRTLTLGQFYNIRLSAANGGDFSMWLSARSDAQGNGPAGAKLTWDAWEAQRTVEWSAWEDARVPSQESTNGGSSWRSAPAAPIVFKCV